jgi:3-oxoacyl-[acyl-carrier-protein] synthase II
MPQPREVVITGLGVVCPLGVGYEAYWSALEAGKSGIDWLSETRDTELPFRHAARIKNFDAKQYVQPRKTIKVMCLEIQAAYAAAALAMQHAQLGKGDMAPERLGIILGSEMLYGDMDELEEVYRHCSPEGRFQAELWGTYAFKDLFPLWMLKYLPTWRRATSVLPTMHGARTTHRRRSASSLLAVGEATSVIEPWPRRRDARWRQRIARRSVACRFAAGSICRNGRANCPGAS